MEIKLNIRTVLLGAMIIEKYGANKKSAELFDDYMNCLDVIDSNLPSNHEKMPKM